MLTINNIEVGRTFTNGKYWLKKYETKLEIRLTDSYMSDQTVKLTDEQTDRIIAFIVDVAKEGLGFEHAKPLDPPANVEEAALEFAPAPEAADLGPL